MRTTLAALHLYSSLKRLCGESERFSINYILYPISLDLFHSLYSIYY